MKIIIDDKIPYIQEAIKKIAEEVDLHIRKRLYTRTHTGC